MEKFNLREIIIFFGSRLQSDIVMVDKCGKLRHRSTHLGEKQTAYDKERTTGTMPKPYVPPSLL